jgi:hypothetical protein
MSVTTYQLDYNISFWSERERENKKMWDKNLHELQ